MIRTAAPGQRLTRAGSAQVQDVRRADSRAPWAIMVLGVALRIAWAIAIPVVPVSDSHAYDVFARNLAQHGVYGWEPASPSAYWPVGTSFLYSLLYRVFGIHHVPIVVVNVMLGAFIVAMTMLLAQRWYGRRAAVVAGALVACWPSLIEFTTVLASELPFMALLLGALALWSGEDRPLVRIAAAGAVLGAACYVRPTVLLVPVVLAALSLARGASRLRVASAMAVALALMALVIAPWSIRNTLLFGRVVLISTNGGANTWMGNNPASSGEYMELPRLEGLDEAERDAHLGREARRYIADHPVRFVARTAVKLVRLHERESIGVGWNVEGLRQRTTDGGILALKVAGNAYWWATLVLAVAGAGVLARRTGWRVVLHPAVALWGYFAAVHAVTVVQDRYHFPSIPFIAMLAAVAVSAARTRRARARVALDDVPVGCS